MGKYNENDIRICLECGEKYIPTKYYQKYCTAACRTAVHSKKYIKKFIVDNEKYCLLCGSVFKPTFKHHVYCSDLCRKKSRKKTYGKDIGDLREYIFERDNFTCACCHKRFPQSMLHAHHKIPLFKGGEDTAENIQSLCINCHKEIHKLWLK